MVETCLGLFPDRHIPISVIAQQCKVLEAGPHVDGVLLPDQLASFVPQQLWRPENTPMAAIMDDPDSLHDAFTLAAYAAMQLFTRETYFYRELAAHLPIRTPRAFAFGDGDETPLLLEDLGNMRTGDQSKVGVLDHRQRLPERRDPPARRRQPHGTAITEAGPPRPRLPLH